MTASTVHTAEKGGEGGVTSQLPRRAAHLRTGEGGAAAAGDLRGHSPGG